MNLTITKERIKTHFTYSWWQYTILIIMSFFMWSLLKSSTGYRSPADLKVDWYYQGYFTTQAEQNATAMLRAFCDEIKPETEEISFLQCGTDETYGVMQLTVWISAGEGDLYSLEKDNFSSMGEAMLDLQPYIDSGALNVDGLSLKKGYLKNSETGEKTLLGIPGENLKGLDKLDISVDGKVFCILANCGNEDTLVAILNKMIQNYHTEDTAK